MEKLELSRSLLEISVNKYDDLLVLDCNDMLIFEKFTTLYDSFQGMATKAEKEIDQIKKKYTSSSKDEVNTNEIRDYLKVRMELLKNVMSELDSVFGSGFTGNVFKESYENNPDFVPDEIALTDLLDSLVPIMEKAYGERIKRNQSKYSASKRGKQSKREK